MTKLEELEWLGRMIDNTMQYANQIGQEMTLHLLSMASLENSSQIEGYANLAQGETNLAKNSARTNKEKH